MYKYSMIEDTKIFFTSDLHFGHNRGFVYKPRGYNSIEEMNEAVFLNFNNTVGTDDEVYILGDLTLGDFEAAKPYLEKLNGNIHVIRGNHDTDTRVAYYKSFGWSVEDACRVRYGPYNFYLSHYPTITANLEEEYLTQATINLHGHTHSKDTFYQDMPLCFNVALDAHNNKPIEIKEIIEQIRNKIKECKEYL